MSKSKLKRHWKNGEIKQKILKFIHKLTKISGIRIIFLSYIAIIIICSLILYSPISQTGKNHVGYFDALFITASSFSDTGLVTKTTYDTWNVFGQAVIAILIMIGGVGIFSLKIFFISILFPKAKSSINEMSMSAHERGSDDFGTAKKIIIRSLYCLFFITFIFGFILTFYFYYAQPWALGQFKELNGLETTYSSTNGDYRFISPYKDWNLAFRYGFFHTISALNNAGFDIIGQNSIMSYYHNIELQVIFIILFVIGGLGFPVIYDLTNYIKYKFKNRKKTHRKYVFKLITKLSVLTYFITTFIGFALMLTFELAARNSAIHFWAQKDHGNWVEKTWSLLFLTLSTRSAGYSSINLQTLSPASILVMTILMFIGAGPVSTGGGIRTTTLAILFLSLCSRVAGRHSVRAFKRKISDETVKMSSIIFSISLLLIFVATFIAYSSAPVYNGQKSSAEYGFVHLIFEVSSAFGTSGLTIGVSEELNIASKITFVLVMFIGQFGISSSILVWGGKKTYKYHYDYVQEEVMIG
ncbi:Ktr system potassium uptake protein B [Mycoplasmopsis bovigenitalium]|uniref:Ktr system potassium uptake protein B n=1 Tax=Mycoplasmopsis bovigenitalium TaxID=2112 RepID=A0A449A9F6_9BACT|nr:potassium transporter TrkG [Mycoplasmopsis bovigenitalium]VEU60913.1 Ktr system potassium uptake protein B [Mycoplasmopsis bovigenitalium]